METYNYPSHKDLAGSGMFGSGHVGAWSGCWVRPTRWGRVGAGQVERIRSGREDKKYVVEGCRLRFQSQKDFRTKTLVSSIKGGSTCIFLHMQLYVFDLEFDLE